jgi:Aminoglycoside N3''-acetyltransferase
MTGGQGTDDTTAGCSDGDRPTVMPTREMGAVAECSRSYLGITRSVHPTVSFAACGAHPDGVERGTVGAAGARLVDQADLADFTVDWLRENERAQDG